MAIRKQPVRLLMLLENDEQLLAVSDQWLVNSSFAAMTFRIGRLSG